MSTLEWRVARHVVAVIWLVSGVLSMGVYPLEQSLLMIGPLDLPRQLGLVLIYGAAALDLLMAALAWWFPGARVWQGQMAVVLTYTVLATWLVPGQWLHPFAPLLKNLAVLALLWLLYRQDSRKEPAG